MEEVTRIVLGVEAPEVAEEVMHFLDRTGRARVVATASDDRQLAEAVRQLEPDAVVAQPTLVRPGGLDGRALLALDTRESVASLRAALRVGARGFYLWPAERDELASAAARTRPPEDGGGTRGRVVAVYGPRGGAGVTFVASHLAAALARRAEGCVLVDMDPQFADLTMALGVPAEGNEPRTVAELLPVIDELTSGRLEEVLWPHSAGFRVLLAPGPEDAGRVRATDLRAAVEAAASTAETVVLHLGRAIDETARGALEAADIILFVLTLDVLAFRAAKRALAVLDPLGLGGRVEFVVNRAARTEVTAADVERVFGRPPLVVIPRDRAVPAAQDRGRLVPLRGRTGRAVNRLARRLLEEAPAGSS